MAQKSSNRVSPFKGQKRDPALVAASAKTQREKHRETDEYKRIAAEFEANPDAFQVDVSRKLGLSVAKVRHVRLHREQLARENAESLLASRPEAPPMQAAETPNRRIHPNVIEAARASMLALNHNEAVMQRRDDKNRDRGKQIAEKRKNSLTYQNVAEALTDDRKRTREQIMKEFTVSKDFIKLVARDLRAQGITVTTHYGPRGSRKPSAKKDENTL